MEHGHRLLILADDFTGACDAAGAFGTARPTRVMWNAESLWPLEVSVLAFDLALRERSTVEAQQTMRAAVDRLTAADSSIRLFVKIDSTLRGPVAGLVRGALEASARSVAVVAPAFPEQGRLFRNGRLVLGGIEQASAPGLPDVLGMERTALLGSSARGKPHDLERAVEHARGRGARQVIVDIEEGETLRELAEAWWRHDDWLLVGSAGLARHIAGARDMQPLVWSTSAFARGPLLVVAGTPAAATHEQLRHLEVLNHTAILRTSPARERDTGEAAARLANDVAMWASTRAAPGAVVLTGGATAREVCRRLGAEALHILGEVTPGVPIGRFNGGVWDGVTVVTKAGGFGTPRTLLDVAHALGVSSATGNL